MKKIYIVINKHKTLRENNEYDMNSALHLPLLLGYSFHWALYVNVLPLSAGPGDGKCSGQRKKWILFNSYKLYQLPSQKVSTPLHVPFGRHFRTIEPLRMKPSSQIKSFLFG